MGRPLSGWAGRASRCTHNGAMPADASTLAAVHLRIRGRVQGVGYRWATVEQARALGLTGWVRNRIDGSVEAVAQGPQQDLDRLVAWCRRGPTQARVDTVDCAACAPDAALRGFDSRSTG